MKSLFFFTAYLHPTINKRLENDYQACRYLFIEVEVEVTLSYFVSIINSAFSAYISIHNCATQEEELKGT